VGADVEIESSLIPGFEVRSHIVLEVDHGGHIHSGFGSVEEVIVATIAVREGGSHKGREGGRDTHGRYSRRMVA
jgi:hypothetical protein